MQLNELISKYIVFVDTCTWMYPEGDPFLQDELFTALSQSEKKVRISGKVVEEVTKHIKSEDAEQSAQAKKAATLINKYNKQGVIEVYQDPDDPFQDQAILAMFMKYRTKFNLAMITQDRKFAKDIDALNLQGSVQSKNNIIVYYIDRYGKLAKWDHGVKEHEKRNGSQSQQQSQTPSQSQPQSSASKKPKDKSNIVRLPLGTKPETGLDTPIAVSHIPAAGERIMTDQYGELELMKELGAGGEGSVFLTSNGMVCKIYAQMTQARHEKLKLMLQIPFDKEGICWPKSLAYNSNGECIGYIMEAASGKVMQLSMFHKKLLEKNFPHWNRQSLAELAINVLDKIQYLHDRNIIVGDINPFNIMIKDYNEVYLVDTDSYQIVNYPCPVGTINFTPPEAQGMRYHEYLRTFEHEYFAVATLVFMILMPGKPPYAQQGGGTPGENIKNMEFPYPFGEFRGNAPDGVWRYIWSHFTYRIKERFFQVFAENNRISTEEWINELEEYAKKIKLGHSNDEIWPMSNKIADDDAVEVTCRDCGTAFVMHVNKKQDLDMKGKPYICNPCLVKMKVVKVARDEAAAAQQAANTSDKERLAALLRAKRTQAGSSAAAQSRTPAASQMRASSSSQQGTPRSSTHTSPPVVTFRPFPPSLGQRLVGFIKQVLNK